MPTDPGESTTNMSKHPSLLHAVFACAALATGLLLAACQDKPAPVELAGANSEPAAAVRLLVEKVGANDYVGFARAALPAEDFAVMEQAWQQDLTRWPVTALPLSDKWLPMLAALGAPGAEAKYQQTFDRQFAGQTKDLKEAARSMGLFLVQFVNKEGHYTDAQRQHYVQLINALSDWAQQAPLADRTRARKTLHDLAGAAAGSGLASDADLRAAGLTGSLERMTPFLIAMRAAADRYRLPLDTTLADLRIGLVEQQGEQATVRIHYPLGTHEIDTVVYLQRRNGGWYLRDYLQQADAARAALAAAAQPPTDAPADTPEGTPALPAPDPSAAPTPDPAST